MPRPEQAADAADQFDPYGHWKALRDSGMEAWSKAMADFVQSDVYATATAQWLDAHMMMWQMFQRATDQAMTQTLHQLKMPTTADIGRLAERLSNLELRLDDLDAQHDESLRLLRGLGEAAKAAGEQASKNEVRLAERLSVMARERDELDVSLAQIQQTLKEVADAAATIRQAQETHTPPGDKPGGEAERPIVIEVAASDKGAGKPTARAIAPAEDAQAVVATPAAPAPPAVKEKARQEVAHRTNGGEGATSKRQERK